jgi:hypothetical protein
MKQQMGSTLVVMLVLLSALAALSLASYEYSLQALQTSAGLLRHQRRWEQTERCLLQRPVLPVNTQSLTLNPLNQPFAWWQQQAKQCKPGVWRYVQRVNAQLVMVSVFQVPDMMLQASYAQVGDKFSLLDWAKGG